MKQRLIWIFAGVCCIASAGCYRKVSSSDGLEISFEAWVPVLLALGGLAAVPVGIVLFIRERRFLGVCVAIAGPVIAAAVAPGMFLDRVIVNQEGFYSRHGFWWSPAIHQIRYDELNRVQVGFDVQNSQRGRRYSYYFDCFFKTGQRERVPLGTLMVEALPEIAEQFRKHGVAVQIPPNLPKDD